MWVQRRLARASPGVSGKGGQFEETVRGGLGVVPRGLTDAGFLRVLWTSEQQGLQQSRGPERADGRREGGAGRPSAWLWAGWVGRPRPRPEGPLATRGQWESRVPLARAEARLARCLPVSHVLPRGRRRLAPPPGVAWQPTPALPSAPLGSALVTPGAPCRRGADGPLWAARCGPSAERVGSARQARGRAHLLGCGAAPGASHAHSLARSQPPGCGAALRPRRGGRDEGRRLRGLAGRCVWPPPSASAARASLWIPGEQQ